MIRTEGLTKYYGNLAALVNLNLHIKQGEIFGFIGPNGAGKTTTMRILATLLQPTRGRAFINGVDVLRSGKDIRRMVGYMPDFMGVYDDLKVYEYLEFFAAAFSIPRKDRRGIIDGVLELTDLVAKRNALVDSLSRGMQQRLQLARVLIHDPKVLILDEPASGLDPRARIEIRELLRELRTMDKTIMISSHILSELEETCDQLGIIEHGRLVFSGTMEQIHQRMGLTRRVRIRVSDQTKAVELLRQSPEVADVNILDGVVEVQLIEGRPVDGTVARVLVSDPDIADPVPIPPNQILVNAINVGSTSLVIWDRFDVPRLYTVEVTADVASIQRQIDELFPDAGLSVRSTGSSIVLSGEVRDPSVVRKAVELAETMGISVVNNVQAPPPEQILLHVEFAEVSRSVIRELGTDLLRILNPETLDHALDQEDRHEIETLSEGFVSIVLEGDGSRLDAAIRLLKNEGAFRSLAQPNLVTREGQQASFLAGGEFPFPVIQGGQSQAVTIVWKEFGVRLNFTPTITNSGNIRLQVEPEVSSLDFGNAWPGG